MEKIKTESQLTINELCSALNYALSNSATLLKTGEQQLEAMQEHLSILVDYVISIGNLCSEGKKSDEADIPSSVKYVVLYSWMGKAKDFLLLWRNVMLEYQKASILIEENRIQNNVLEKLLAEAKIVISKAQEEVQTNNIYREAEAHSISQSIKIWKHQDTPWEIYKEQFETLKGQGLDLVNQQEKLVLVSQIFKGIREKVKRLPKQLIQNIQNLEIDIKKSFANIPEEGYSEREVLEILGTVKLDLHEFSDAEKFTDHIDESIEGLPDKAKYFIGINDGTLLFKEINIQKYTSAWLESEIYPFIYQAYGSYENISNKVNLSKLNIRNQLGFNKRDEQKKRLIVAPPALDNLYKSLQKPEKEYAEIEDELNLMIDKELLASNLYKSRFLTISVSSTLNQYKRYQVQGWRRFQEWFESQEKIFGKIKERTQKEESMSLSEKIVRVIKYRTPQQGLSNYTNMFLTQGYIGDSFVAGRKNEMEKVDHLVANWKMGFRGTLLISGERFSGKTFLGTMIHNKYFKNTTIRLSPNHTIRIGGRHMDVDYNLKDALDFIIKYGSQKKYMIWIDDLILWQNNKISITSNVRRLIQIMDTYSSKFFFTISTSSMLRHQLNLFFEVSKVFQSEIHLNGMPYQDIKAALLIRHYATQHLVVDASENELNANEMEKVIRSLYLHSNGNIGNMLKLWSYHVLKVGDDTVSIRADRYYSLPPFMSTEVAMILQTILLHRKINEFMLLKKFGPSFHMVFKPTISRLLGIGILVRSGDGTIKVNSYLTNEISEMVKDHLLVSKERLHTNKIKI